MEHVPAELAIGDALEADALLHRHQLADVIVLDGAQLGIADLAGLMAPARLQQGGGAQEAANMLCPEWGYPSRHNVLLFGLDAPNASWIRAE
jgi:hypothetical protein